MALIGINNQDISYLWWFVSHELDHSEVTNTLQLEKIQVQKSRRHKKCLSLLPRVRRRCFNDCKGASGNRAALASLKERYHESPQSVVDCLLFQ